MWIPYEDAVVVVCNDPLDSSFPEYSRQPEEEQDLMEPLVDLLLKQPGNVITKEQAAEMGFGELRDELIKINPLDVEHIKKINRAEHEFWSRSQGYRIKDSDKLLQFDCGGQQWVLEQSFPTQGVKGASDSSESATPANTTSDMKLMTDLLESIESSNLPAPAPIEQRWTAPSSSYMSPAGISEATPQISSDSIFSWVGIIMYLPTDEPVQRESITKTFQEQYRPLFDKVGERFMAVPHFAKLEAPPQTPDYDAKLEILRRQLQDRYPLAEFNALREIMDPKNILGTKLVDELLGVPNWRVLNGKLKLKVSEFAESQLSK